MVRYLCGAGLCRSLVLLALCVSAVSFPARAQWTPRIEGRVANPRAALPAGELLVNGVVVLRLRSELGGYLPEQRIEVAAERLRAAVAAGVGPEDILADIESDRAAPRLKAMGQVIAIATADEAKGSGSSPAELVQSWVRALRKALSLPGLTLAANEVMVPLGETRVLRVGGAARGPITVTSLSGTAHVAASPGEAGTGEITLRGVSAGRETLAVGREGATVTVMVAVQRYAGSIQRPRPVVVTGATVPADFVARHVLANALSAARLSPGATVRITAPSVPIAPVSGGRTQTITVPLALSGPDMIPVRGVVRVPVINRKLPSVKTATLLYSNNPERVTGFGTLFVGRLAKDNESTRLLYHHQSAMDKAAWFTVELINDGNTPAAVHVVGGSAGPVLDTVWVGYRAASIFLRDYLQDVGALVEVPAKSRMALTAQRLAPTLTISGLSELRQMSGDPLLVRVAADIPGDARAATAELVATPNPWGGEMAALSEHVYPEPLKALKAEYRVGDRWTFVSIGRNPIKGAKEGRQLEGNFGVFYDIELTLENPTDKEAAAQIVFEPSAGLAGGIFLLDGRPVEIPQADLPAEITLARYILPPGGKQTVQLKTLPLSGSNYPIRLTVRP